MANFEKPKGDPSAYVKPATTVLSPYLKVSYSWGVLCLILEGFVNIDIVKLM